MRLSTNRSPRRSLIVLFGLAALCATLLTAQDPASPIANHDLQILTNADLPDSHPGQPYLEHLVAQGGVSHLVWRVQKGSLPPGIHLTEQGALTGAAERSGEFQFTVSVTDSSSPHQAVEKVFVIRVRSALTLDWKSPAHVNGNRIEGSVLVSNDTGDDLDLTFVVEAVAQNGRGTAIGYQHFLLKKKTFDKELPFGETLPHGGYVVHVDAVGEVPPRNLIYHERMQTPASLQVMVGP